MSIANRSDLLSAIVEWYVNRSDLQPFAADFIELSEGLFNTELRCREMEKVADLSPTDSICTLPDDFLEQKRVVEKAAIRRPLEYITADAADHLYPSRVSGLSCHFMITGDELTALPLSSNDIELTYYQKIPALTEDSPTNWLLTKLPNLYLHAGIMHAAEFVKNQERFAQEAVIVRKYIDSLQSLDTRSRFGNAGVVLTGNTP